MDNISTNLLRFNGEIGPQYLDPDDKTGGPDGTMKPITKDVLREMIILNLPEIQKVQDEYVKAELESIKQTQQQILQRLNQPIDTQLTGSNTVYILFDALALTDTNRVLSQTFDISGLSRFYLFVRSTIDVEVRLGIRVRASKNEVATNAVMFWNGQQYETTFPTNNTGLPIPNTQNAWILLNSRYEWINNIIASDIAIQLMATQVPTTGSISVYLVGRS